MGSPPQIVSLRPSTSDADLYVVNREQCAPQYNDSCIGLFGGVFDYAKSSTFLQVAQGQWNGTVEPNPNQLSFVHFNDLLTFGNASIYGYPSLYDEPGYGGQGVLPLAPGSDFLRIALETNSTPSTVFGMWTGSRSIDHPVDGSLVLGGYDTTRINGTLTTFDSQETCALCVIITGLTYQDDSGTTNLFSNASESLQVNLNPSQRVLNVPQGVWDNFKNATHAYYNASYLSYASTAVPTGNVTVTLQNGYKTIIPAEELFYYPRTFNNKGQYDILNNTYQISTIINATNDGYVLDWGIPYMTMNYIIADYERSQFQMAPAIRTDFDNIGGGYVLKASCDPVTQTTAGPTSSSTTAGPGPTTTTTAAASHKSSNVGPIVGGVVGGLAVLVLIVCGAAFFLIRRRRQAKAAAAGAHGRSEMTTPLAGGSMPHQGGSQADRYSNWTALSPAETPSELGGAEKARGANSSVNQWLSSQASDVSSVRLILGEMDWLTQLRWQTQTVVSSTSPNPNVGATLGHNMGSPQTPHQAQMGTMDRPFEMPAQHYDVR